MSLGCPVGRPHHCRFAIPPVVPDQRLRRRRQPPPFPPSASLAPRSFVCLVFRRQQLTSRCSKHRLTRGPAVFPPSPPSPVHSASVAASVAASLASSRCSPHQPDRRRAGLPWSPDPHWPFPAYRQSPPFTVGGATRGLGVHGSHRRPARQNTKSTAEDLGILTHTDAGNTAPENGVGARVVGGLALWL